MVALAFDSSSLSCTSPDCRTTMSSLSDETSSTPRLSSRWYLPRIRVSGVPTRVMVRFSAGASRESLRSRRDFLLLYRLCSSLMLGDFLRSFDSLLRRFLLLLCEYTSSLFTFSEDLLLSRRFRLIFVLPGDVLGSFLTPKSLDLFRAWREVLLSFRLRLFFCRSIEELSALLDFFECLRFASLLRDRDFFRLFLSFLSMLVSWSLSFDLVFFLAFSCSFANNLKKSREGLTISSFPWPQHSQKQL